MTASVLLLLQQLLLREGEVLGGAECARVVLAPHPLARRQHLDLQLLGLGKLALLLVRVCQVGGGAERLRVLLATQPLPRRQHPRLHRLGLGVPACPLERNAELLMLLLLRKGIPCVCVTLVTLTANHVKVAS